MKRALVSTIAALIATAAWTAPALADVVTLDFEGVGDSASVNDFYNGGTDSAGNSGIDYGINFTSTSLGLIDSDAGGSGNIANEPSGQTGLFFLDGDAAVMNVLAGFDTGFSFFYSAAAGLGGSVTVYDGIDGTGNVLASLLLSPNSVGCSGDPNGAYCEWTPVGVNFAGSALSVGFGGSANFIVFDDVTLGSATPGQQGAVPEPATWAMMLLGFGAVGFAMRRRKQTELTFRRVA